MNREKIIKAARRRKKCNLPHKTSWMLETEWQKYIMDVIRLEDERTSDSFEKSFLYLKKERLEFSTTLGLKSNMPRADIMTWRSNT